MFMVSGKILVLLIIDTLVAIPQGDYIWWSPDKVRLRSAEGDLIDILPECTSNELNQSTIKYETCHTEHLARLDQYYIQQSDEG